MDVETVNSSKSKPSSYQDKLLWVLFKSPPEQHQAAKFVFGFAFGAFMGFYLYSCMISAMDWGVLNDRKNMLIAQTTISSGLITGLSTTWRCVYSIILPSSLLGKGAVGFLVAYQTIIVMKGPVANIVLNAEKMVDAIGCCSRVASDNYGRIQGIVVSPANSTVEGMAQSKTSIQEVGAQFEKKYNTIDAEVQSLIEVMGETEDKERQFNESLQEARKVCQEEALEDPVEFDECVESRTKEARENVTFFKSILRSAKDPENLEAKRVALQQYKTKSDDICREFKSLAKAGCQRAMYKSVTKKCKDAIGHTLGICQRMGEGLYWSCGAAETLIVCKNPPRLNDETIEAYIESRRALNTIKREFQFNISANFNTIENPFKNVSLSIDVKFTYVKQSFSYIQMLIKFLVYTLQIYNVYSFVQVLRRMFIYVRQYNKNISFDNKYMSDYFLKIEQRRSVQRKVCLFPLKKSERKQLVSIAKLAPSSDERKKLLHTGLYTVIRHVIFFSLFGFDQLISRAMYVTSRSLYLDVEIEAYEKIDTKVRGDGLIANIVRKIGEIFQSNNRLSQRITTTQCIPEPSFLNESFINLFIALCIFQWILHYTKIFMGRSFHLIAALYYHKREKKRILYLYNRLLKDRIKSFEMSKQNLILHLCGKREKKIVSIDLITWFCRKVKLCFISKCCRKKQKEKDCDLCGDKACDVTKDCPLCNFCVCHVCLRLTKGGCVRCKVEASLAKFTKGKCAVCGKVFLSAETMIECGETYGSLGKQDEAEKIMLCEECFDKK